MTDPSIRHDESARQFEVDVDGDLAVLTYRLAPGEITFLHTGVPESVERHGIGTRLVEAGLAYAREHHLTVVPVCPFVAAYLEKHPEQQDLVREEDRVR